MELAEEHVDVRAVPGHTVQPLGREPFPLDELDALLHEQRHAVGALTNKQRFVVWRRRQRSRPPRLTVRTAFARLARYCKE
ncbi:hypothetical protein MSG28_011528 [Choristoneura fumiferana]|uniref:Uncharacterized protein n=1 Tax=Choristoneura fumiferana TaxID=7141 RepID=A0ACC0JNR6_CHOFU|nr:hypothetical protein MSG28_011528 [Choristoneura fumiferana]